MKRLMFKTVMLMGTAFVGWLAWQKQRDVSNPWPPKDWDPRPEDRTPDADPEPDPSEPDMAPEPEDGPQTAPEVVPEPTPQGAPEPESEPVPQDEPESEVDPIVAWANTADADALRAAGLSAAAVRKVLEHRPFSDLQALSQTRGIGPKTLEALSRAAH